MNKMASKDTPLSIEDIFKSSGNLDAPSKLQLLTDKYEELLQLYRSQESIFNSTKREVSALTTDRNKQILARSRLEGVCRQLQKQNKTIKDENLLKLRDEEEKRKKITQEFQKTLNNVTTMMTDSTAQNTKLGEENRQMAERLSSIYDEFKTRENDVDRISKQIDIERQLADARCAKVKTEFLIEKQTMLSENEVLKGKVAQLTKDLIDATNKTIVLERQVIDVTAQLDQYTGKYEEFEHTMTKSGRVFDQCKTELNRMTKQVKSLEKEVVEWQTRYHQSVTAIYEVQVENNEKKRIIADLTKKQNQLTKLCRQLQNERKAYMNSLRDLGKDPNDIFVESSADDPTIEEIIKPVPINLAAGDADDIRHGAKPKPMLKAKRGKHKGKRGREVAIEPVCQLTPKEIELAELKQELRRVQHLVEIETNPGSKVADVILESQLIGKSLSKTIATEISEGETEAVEVPVPPFEDEEVSLPGESSNVEDLFSKLSLEDKPKSNTNKTDDEYLIESDETSGIANLSPDTSAESLVEDAVENSEIKENDDIIIDEACCSNVTIIERNSPSLPIVNNIDEAALPIEREEDVDTPDTEERH